MSTSPSHQRIPRFAITVLALTFFSIMGCADSGSPVAVTEDADTEDDPPHHLQIDTLDLEVNNVWVKVSALPFPVVDEVTMRWEVNATTRNPYWSPRTFRKRGRSFFTEGDSAQVWGNVPRAYDFTVTVQIEAWGKVYDVDTLRIEAPKCPEGPPTLICNL